MGVIGWGHGGKPGANWQGLCGRKWVGWGWGCRGRAGGRPQARRRSRRHGRSPCVSTQSKRPAAGGGRVLALGRGQRRGRVWEGAGRGGMCRGAGRRPRGGGAGPGEGRGVGSRRKGLGAGGGHSLAALHRVPGWGGAAKGRGVGVQQAGPCRERARRAAPACRPGRRGRPAAAPQSRPSGGLPCGPHPGALQKFSSVPSCGSPRRSR